MAHAPALDFGVVVVVLGRVDWARVAHWFIASLIYEASTIDCLDCGLRYVWK